MTEPNNYTSNVAPIWRAAGCDLAEFDGRPALELGPVARAAAVAILTEPRKYRELEPPNGWGDAEGAARYLVEIANECDVHQFAVVRVSR